MRDKIMAFIVGIIMVLISFVVKERPVTTSNLSMFTGLLLMYMAVLSNKK